MEIWVTILSSSLVSGATAAIVSGWFNLTSKNNEYKNAYFKIVLDKRIVAYTEVDQLISTARITHIDEKNHAYHAMFTPQDVGVSEFYVLIYKAMAEKFWLSDDIYTAIRDLNLIAYPANDNQEKLLSIAKEKYKEIASIRSKIEKIHARDMLTLHMIPQFLKQKEFNNTYQELPQREA